MFEALFGAYGVSTWALLCTEANPRHNSGLGAADGRVGKHEGCCGSGNSRKGLYGVTGKILEDRSNPDVFTKATPHGSRSIT